MKKGLLLVIEGVDGSGKAVQSQLLVDSLNADGIPAGKVDFPTYDRNVFGTLIGECLAGKHGDFLHLDPKIASSLYAVDRFESSPHIRNMLASSMIVIADRFSSANQIHQGGKIADVEERKEFMLWLDHMEHEVLGVPRPDAVIYLQVSLQTSLALLAEKRSRKNATLALKEKDQVEGDPEYLKRSYETATWLAEHQPNWKVVECEKQGVLRSKEDIHREIAAYVKGLSFEQGR